MRSETNPKEINCVKQTTFFATSGRNNISIPLSTRQKRAATNLMTSQCETSDKKVTEFAQSKLRILQSITESTRWKENCKYN